MTTLAHRALRLRRPGGPRPAAATDRPRWERPALAALLLVTAVVFLWNLGSSGYANSFYSAAAQAGSRSWKAFLFGSLDSANAITVDKPPAALWPMALSVRLFGLGGWQILVPQALMGVAAVAVLFASVRRLYGPAAGLLAGGLLAVTPVAALMFRFNNPDALLCLLMVSALYLLTRALEDGRTRWLVLCGLVFGAAFLVKTLQAWLILPVVAVVYLVCGPPRLRRRTGQVLLGGLAALAGCGWYVALVELWPAGSRPYIGGSQHNSFLELTLGYNGLGRITGDETGSVGGGHGPGGGGHGGGAWGQTGITRLFGDSMGGQISWLLPAALLLLVAGLVVTRQADRTDVRRAAFLAWGGSLLMTGAVFSFMSGIIHQYYNIALAPYVAAVVAMGAVALWRRRAHRAAAGMLALTSAATAVWGYVLLARSEQWLPWLRWTVLAVGLLAALGLPWLGRLPRRLGAALVALGLAAGFAGPVAYTLNTVRTPHTGSIVTAGPSTGRGGFGGPGGGPPGGRRGAQGWFARHDGGQPPQGVPGRPGQGSPPGGWNRTGRPAAGNGGAPTAGAVRPGRGGFPGAAERGGHGDFGGGMGGLLGGVQVSSKAAAALGEDASDYTWAAAAVGSQNAAAYQLATEQPVMAIGGFNGSDPYPTLAQFKKYVAQHKIHWFIGGGRGGGMGGRSRGAAAAVSTWVTEHFEKVESGSATLYDLTREK